MSDVIAVVDMGSNSLHLQVVRGRKVLALHRAAVQLGNLVDDNIPLSMVREAADALSHFESIADGYGASMKCFATAALRDAQNRDEVLSLLPTPVTILSPVQEAEMAYQGAVQALGLSGPTIVFDLGGRSTEVVRGLGTDVRETWSFPVGHLTLHERTADFSPVAGARGRLVGTAGTAMTLGRMAAAARGENPVTRHALEVDLDELRAVVESIDDSVDPGMLPGSDPRRGATLRVAAHAVLKLVETLAAPGYVTSEAGLREGLVEACR